MAEPIDWNQYAAELVSKGVGTGTDFDLLTRFARGRLLDAGCGIGAHLAYLAEAVGDTAVGVDIGFPALRFARARFPHVMVVAGSLAAPLPFRDERFDTIYSIDVVEHLQCPELAVKEFYRLCKPGGHVIIQTPNYPIKRVYDFLHVLRGTRARFKDDPTHVSKLNYYRLSTYVSESGFRIVVGIARNLLLEKYIPLIKRLRGTHIGRLFGQKIIVVGKRPESL